MASPFDDPLAPQAPGKPRTHEQWHRDAATGRMVGRVPTTSPFDDPAAPQGPSPEAVRASMIGGQARSLGQDARDAVLNGLPAIGGMAGGALGGAGGTILGMGVGGWPGAVGGATAGGMGGEAMRQLAMRALGLTAPQTPGAAAGAIGAQGILQGAAEAGGQAIGAGAKFAGRSLMRTALSPTAPVQKKAEQVAARGVYKALGPDAAQLVPPDYSALADQALAERVGVTGKGFQQVVTKIKTASDKLDEILGNAGASGKRYTVFDLTGPMADLRAAISKESTPQAALAKLDKKIAAMVAARRNVPTVAGRPGKLMKLTPLEVNELKKVWQEAAEAIYQPGAPRGPKAMFESRFQGTAAKGAQNALEQIGGVAEKNARMAELKPLRTGIEEALRRKNPPMPLVGSVINGLPLVGPALNALPTRTIMSQSALGLTDPYLQLLLRQAPHLATYFQTAPPSQGGEP